MFLFIRSVYLISVTVYTYLANVIFGATWPLSLAELRTTDRKKNGKGGRWIRTVSWVHCALRPLRQLSQSRNLRNVSYISCASSVNLRPLRVHGACVEWKHCFSEKLANGYR